MLLCQFLVLAGNWQFFVVAGKFYYDRKKKFQSSVWRVVLLCQFSVLAVNWQFFCCGGKVLLRPEKKNLSILLWRESFITTGKKSSIYFVVLVLRLAGCAM